MHGMPKKIKAVHQQLRQCNGREPPTAGALRPALLTFQPPGGWPVSDMNGCWSSPPRNPMSNQPGRQLGRQQHCGNNRMRLELRVLQHTHWWAPLHGSVCTEAYHHAIASTRGAYAVARLLQPPRLANSCQPAARPVGTSAAYPRVCSCSGSHGVLRACVARQHPSCSRC